MMYKGRRFKSVTALREYYGLSRPLYYFRRYAGIPLDAPKGVPGRHAAGVSRVEVVTPDGMSYPSIAAYARALGIHEGAARYRVRSGHLTARPLRRTCEYGGKYYRSHVAMYKDLRLPYGKGEALRKEHEMSVCRTKVADYYHLDGLEDPRLEGELVKDFIAEAKSQIKYRFSVRDVFGDRLERMAVMYAKDKAPKLTVQDDIYDLHLDMARVYLPDIENAEVESYNHAD